jgi:Protein of unknown function (DUF2971)
MDRRLYHYQPLDPDRVRPVIEQNQVYFSNPGNFNDPWDCRPCFDSSLLVDANARERHVGYYMDIARSTPRSEPELRELERRLRQERGFLETLVKKMNDGLYEDIFKRYRVYCLSEKPDCTLMWSHYGGNHSGVCLEFDRSSEPIRAALRVTYSTSYPSFDLTDKSDRSLAVLTSKSDVWSYEAEYRLVAQERSVAMSATGRTLMTDNNFLILPVGALRAVIVGCMMSDENKRLLEGMVRRAPRSVEVRQAVRSPNRYALDIS